MSPRLVASSQSVMARQQGRAAARTTADEMLRAAAHEQGRADRSLDGVYYTPGAVASYMARQMLATIFDDSRVRTRRLQASGPDLAIVDPACGAGSLLAALIDELVDWYRSGPSLDIETTQFSVSLCGVDCDAAALALADERLRRMASEAAHQHPRLQITIVTRVGDALLGPGFVPLNDVAPDGENGVLRDCAMTGDSDDPGALPIDWRASFPDTAARGGFDAVLMNPPYVATYARRSKRDRLPHRSRLEARFGHVGGRLNLFTCFLGRALDLLAPDGVCTCIAPDPLAAAASYAPIRRSVAARLPRQAWTLLTPAVFGANVRNVIVTAAAGAAQVTARVVDDLSDLEGDRAIARSEAITVAEPGGRVTFLRSGCERAIHDRIITQPRRLDELFVTRDGVNPGPRSVRDRLIDPVDAEPEFVRPLITGTQIDARGYRIHPPVHAIHYDPAILTPAERKAGASLRKPVVFSSPKIVSRQTADTIIAAIDVDQDLVALNSVHCTRVIDGSDELLWGLLALLNSPLVRLFYAVDGGETRQVLPQVHIAWLRRLPLPDRAPELLTDLAPAARDIHARDVDDPARRRRLHLVHRRVCHDYGLDDEGTDQVRHALVARYPRMVAEWGQG